MPFTTVKHLFAALLLSLCTIISAHAQSYVDTLTIYSTLLQRNSKAVVIRPSLPPAAKGKGAVMQRRPVLYLLHGYSGNYSNWILKVPQLTQLARAYNMYIVCPDGDYAGWYTDSKVKPHSMYHSYIAAELVNYIDKHYPTLTTPAGRAITGLSMGGYGALTIAALHPETFGAAGSMSGALSPSQISGKYELQQIFGSFTDTASWKRFDAESIILAQKPRIPLIFDCGNDDYFAAVNAHLHSSLQQAGIAHTYIARPGNHNWPYWSQAINYQLLFFSRFFSGGAMP